MNFILLYCTSRRVCWLGILHSVFNLTLVPSGHVRFLPGLLQNWHIFFKKCGGAPRTLKRTETCLVGKLTCRYLVCRPVSIHWKTLTHFEPKICKSNHVFTFAKPKEIGDAQYSATRETLSNLRSFFQYMGTICHWFVFGHMSLTFGHWHHLTLRNMRIGWFWERPILWVILGYFPITGCYANQFFAQVPHNQCSFVMYYIPGIVGFSFWLHKLYIYNYIYISSIQSAFLFLFLCSLCELAPNFLATNPKVQLLKITVSNNSMFSIF